MNLLLVGLGGSLGAVSRFWVGKIMSQKFGADFPWGTFCVNILGALLLGILSAFGADKNIYLLFGDGFLGAFTTFSSFMYEGFNLFKGSEKLNAFAYVSGTLILGIIGYFMGFGITGMLLNMA